MALRIVRLGSPRARGEGLRLGAVRRPPRGVPKADFARLDWYDLWLPLLAPSAGLVKQARAAADEREWQAFVKRFRAELAEPAPRQALDLLAALSHGSAVAIGCYCADEARCHRSVLRAELAARGADIAP